MLCRKQDATLRIDLETPHTCGDTAGESQLAWGIEEQEHAFADSVALGAGPKANPLRDGQILSWSSSANGILDVECDRHSFDGVPSRRRTTRNAGNHARKDCPRCLGHDSEAKCFWRYPGRQNSEPCPGRGSSLRLPLARQQGNRHYRRGFWRQLERCLAPQKRGDQNES